MTGPINLDDYRWLIGDAAAAWLAELRHATNAPVALAARLRRELSAARTHLVLDQADLRRRAVGKFGRLAERMYFTPRGLEQATDLAVAAYKASRFPVAQPIADLCCGIGGDLLALAACGSVQGVDSDAICALLAEANCKAALDLPEVVLQRAKTPPFVVHCCDVERFDLTDVAAWHIDPDRRPHGRRTTRVELHQPGPDVIEALRSACPHAAVKLAPAAVLPERWEQEAELEWISRDGECRQLVAWFGGLTGRPGLRRATIVEFATSQATNAARTFSPAARAHIVLRTVFGIAGERVESSSQLGQFLFEPDAAVLAADLRGALAAKLKLRGFEPGIAYLTGDKAIEDAALDCFEVDEVLPFQPKRLRAMLRERGIGRLEVKQRGTRHDANQWQRELASSGDRHATLFITRLAGKVTAILARRVAERDRQ